jgi:hypothetical protein
MLPRGSKIPKAGHITFQEYRDRRVAPMAVKGHIEHRKYARYLKLPCGDEAAATLTLLSPMAASRLGHRTVRLQWVSEVDYYVDKKLLLEKCPFYAEHQPPACPGSEPCEVETPFHLYGRTKEALDAFVHYLYHSSYAEIVAGESDARCATHAYVYIFADRIYMDELKHQALVNMAAEFKALEPYKHSAEAVMRLQCVVCLDTDNRSEIPIEETWDDACLAYPRALMLPSEPSSPVHPRPVDKMRNLIAYYASSMLGALRQNQDFLNIMEARCEFRDDLLVHLPNRTCPFDYGSFC